MIGHALHRYIGNQMVSKKHVKERIFFLEHVVQGQPKYQDYQLLGVAYLYSGQADKAVEVFKMTIEQRPKDWEAYYHLGLIYMQQFKRYDDAAALFEQVLTFIPNFPMIEDLLKKTRQGNEIQSARRALLLVAPSTAPDRL